ncbi:MAG: hypothetical protein ACK4N5_12675, partial [Myxococcales bacterium]
MATLRERTEELKRRREKNLEMGGAERVGQLDEDAQGLGERGRRAVETRLQRLPFDVLHDDARQAVGELGEVV